MKGRCIYEGRKKSPGIFEIIENKMLFKNQGYPWNVSWQKKTNSGNFRKKSHNVTCESPFLQKFPDFLNLFATARFYNSKGKRRCAGCRFVTDAVGAQISIKKSRNFMRNG